MNKTDLRGLGLDEIKDIVVSLGESAFRAKQIYGWFCKGAQSFDDMKNIPSSLKSKLEENGYYCGFVKIREKYVSKKDGTVKYLMELFDGECIETVVMEYHHGLTICVSSQVGCLMGCTFCASTLLGKKRNLSAGEIIGQIFTAEKDIGKRISNIVMMGIGEPLDNFENVKRFLKLVNDKDCLNIGYRHISLSTCGLADKIPLLSDMNIPITLSVSLHAPTNEIRTKMMPVNKRFPIEVLLDACIKYQSVTGRRISFEYAMCDGVNDSEEHAYTLAKLLKPLLCHVNLIPVNNVKERNYKKSKRETIERFIEVLDKNGICATVRRELGSDISASCGQLRQRSLESK